MTQRNQSTSASSAVADPAEAPLVLDVRDLRTYFHTEYGKALAVDGISFSVRRGQTLAIVGESGCGKTVTALSILKLIPMPPGEIVSGQILLEGVDLVRLSQKELQAVRGGRAAMIFQEPATSLNPVYTIGDQLIEAIRLHPRKFTGPDGREVTRRATKAEAREITLGLLEEVQMSEPTRRIDQYPHELSGGMKQRAMIAMALSCNPKLIIADEPTTALDVTIQARILETLRKMRERYGTAVLLITHDLGVVAETADDVVVMYAGRIVEKTGVHALFAKPLHPYTIGLLNSLPDRTPEHSRLQAIPGNVPPPTRFPTGCRFRARCPLATQKCLEDPSLVEIEPGHFSACWFAGEIASGTKTVDFTKFAGGGKKP